MVGVEQRICLACALATGICLVLSAGVEVQQEGWGLHRSDCILVIASLQLSHSLKNTRKDQVSSLLIISEVRGIFYMLNLDVKCCCK